MKKIFILISCIVFVFLLTACNGTDVNSTELPTTTITPGSPEETIEAFIQALEADNTDTAASYFISQDRQDILNLFQKADLPALAQDLRKFPPERMSEQTPNETYILYLTKRIVNDQEYQITMSLVFENNAWRIAEF